MASQEIHHGLHCSEWIQSQAGFDLFPELIFTYQPVNEEIQNGILKLA
jgi:hypothetical protein